jgi:hypothetical protein
MTEGQERSVLVVGGPGAMSAGAARRFPAHRLRGQGQGTRQGLHGKARGK